MDNMNLQTVERALVVLELIAQQPLTPQALESALGLNRTTVARLIYTLASRGYIERDGRANRYKLGLKVVELGSIRLNQVELKTEASVYLRELSNKLNQVCHMGILSDGDVVYIDKVEPINTIRMFSQIGKRVPVHSTSLGKSLLSGIDDDKIIEILKDKGMQSFTPNTHTDIETMILEIARVRKNGYGVDDEENEDHIWCVSAPIKDYRNKIIAAISTSGHNRDSIKNSKSKEVILIKETAAKISKRMGYNE